MSTTTNSMNYTTLLFKNDSNVVKWSYVISLFGLIVLCGYFVKKANLKILKIQNPNTNHSYCVISIYVLKVTRVSIVMLVIGYLLQLYMIIADTPLYEGIDSDTLNKDGPIFKFAGAWIGV